MSPHFRETDAQAIIAVRRAQSNFGIPANPRRSRITLILAPDLSEGFHDRSVSSQFFSRQAQPAAWKPCCGLLRPPSQRLVAVVCHPHPLFGGTMHNKVVYQAAKALHQRGIPVLRFNFRGAALSEGEHDRGRGEQDDVRTALDFLAQRIPGTPNLLAGFSFGSWVGLRVGCEDERVTQAHRPGDTGRYIRFELPARLRQAKTHHSGRERPIRIARKHRSAFATLPSRNGW